MDLKSISIDVKLAILQCCDKLSEDIKRLILKKYIDSMYLCSESDSDLDWYNDSESEWITAIEEFWKQAQLIPEEVKNQFDWESVAISSEKLWIFPAEMNSFNL